MHGSYTVAASLTFQISQMFDNFWMQNHSKCHPAIADNHCDFSQHSTKLLRNSLSAMAEGSGMASATIAAEEFNLFTKWWFYVLLFLGLYAFVVAVHLFIDYRQWESDRVKLMMEEAGLSAPSGDKDRQPATKGAVKKDQ
eukprot:s9000_g2.t1